MKVLIAGSGFSGSRVARGLGQRAGVEVVIVNSDNFLLFTPMLAEAAVGDVDPRHIIAPIRQLAPRAEVVQGVIESVDAPTRSLVVNRLFGAATETIAADALVLALGSVTNTYGVTGADEHALPFKTIVDALRIRNRILARMEAEGTLSVAVIGAGFSGAELTAALADFLGEVHRRFYPAGPAPRVTLVDAVDRVTPALTSSLSDSAARALQNRDVRLVLGSAVTEVGPQGVRLENDEMVEAETVIWAAGIKPHPLLARSGVETDRGRIPVDAHFRTAIEGVYAVGDAALSPSGDGGFSPPTAQFALRQGRYLGKHLDVIQAGRQVPPFSYATKGELVSLGHHNAVGRVLGIPVSGLVGWFLWRSYYLLQLPTTLRKARVALDWTLDVFFPPDIAWLPSSDLGPL
ncbi:MAG TPA: NAD(P)/FAD-dependent oxidoreductase [Acidimicrobiia bacterium]|jgi:NADH dehydrogenase|nr:NAD(P)/FAD-dependent oxidoreductase [Acidimicrobiia bacterium]